MNREASAGSEVALDACPECGHATVHHDEDGCKFCGCKWTPEGQR